MEPTSKNAPESARQHDDLGTTDDYLTRQITDARLALESTLDDLKLDLADAADARRWVQKYPWAAIGTAAVAGFTLSYLITRPRRRRDADAHDEPPDAESNQGTARTEPLASPSTDYGWKGVFFTALFDLLRIVISQLVPVIIRQAGRRSDPPRTAAPPTPTDGPSPPHDEHAPPETLS